MSVSFNVTGKFLRKDEEVIINESFKKRTFYVEVTVNPQYKEVLCFDLVNEKTALIEGYNEGDLIIVSFNIKCRESKKEGSFAKYFTVLQAWKINRQGGEQVLNGEKYNNSTSVDGTLGNENENNDEIPF